MRPELPIGDGMQDSSEKVHGRKKHKKETAAFLRRSPRLSKNYPSSRTSPQTGVAIPQNLGEPAFY